MLKHGERPKTKFWGFYDGEKYRRFNQSKDLLKYLRQCEPLNLLHHANFDVIQLLIDGAKVQILKSHNGRLIKCKLYEHILTNTFSCFPISLGSIFKAFGYQKTDLGKLAKRNYDDCVLGLDCFLKMDSIFESLIGVSPLVKGTIAATGFGAAEICAGKMPKDLRFLESYRGGRVEVFNTNEMSCGKFDINSSYPTSILQCPTTDRLMRLRVKTKDWFCPFFKADESEMLLFPNGEFETWIYESNLEKYILPNCEKTSVKVLEKHPIDFEWLNNLKQLIEKLYELKQKETGGIRLVCKFGLNSLYGRIGLKGESERARVLDYPVDGDDITCSYIGKNRWIVFDKIERESRSNFPFASFITDNARARLYQSFVKNKAIYGDTDSVFTVLPKKSFNGIIGHKCGDWTFEKRAILKAQNIKDYMFDDEETRKGGSDSLTWSLKQFASGKNVQAVHRERRTGLRKRLVLPNGDTTPLTVKQ